MEMTYQNRLAPRALLVSSIIAFLVAVWWISDDRGKQNADVLINELHQITIAQTGDFLLYSVLYVAQDAGLFEKNGLEVKIISTGGDEKSVAAVIAGQAQFGVGDPTFAPIANERGQDLRVISSIVNGVPFWGITYSEGVRSQYELSGLEGLRVATFPAPSTAFTLQKDMFEDAGLEPNIVEGAFGSLVGILESGNADIALELEPNVSSLTHNGAFVLYSMSQIYGDFAITGLTASERYLNEHTGIAKAAVSSLQSAMDLINENPERAVEILENRFPELEAEVVRASFQRLIEEHVIPSDTEITLEAWQKAIDLRIEVGDLTDRDNAINSLRNEYSKD